jgi:hypothetical protein
MARPAQACGPGGAPQLSLELGQLLLGRQQLRLQANRQPECMQSILGPTLTAKRNPQMEGGSSMGRLHLQRAQMAIGSLLVAALLGEYQA